MNELFIRASRNKYRFEYNGMITVEDLFDLRFNELDAIYKDLKAELKDEIEDSLMSKKTIADKVLEDKISIVKYIFNLKKEEAEARLLASENKAKKQQLLAIKKMKEEEKLKDMSIEEIDKMIAELE